MRRPSSLGGDWATPGVQEPIGRLDCRSGGRMQVACAGRFDEICSARRWPALPCSCRCPDLAVASNDDVYTVGNYPVDAQAANAVARQGQGARRGSAGGLPLALEARRAGDGLRAAEAAHGAQVVRLLRGRSVRSERNSSTRYIASLDFSFRPIPCATVLQQEGMPFVEEQAREIIVMPVVRDAQGAPDAGSAARSLDRSLEGPRPRAHARPSSCSR